MKQLLATQVNRTTLRPTVALMRALGWPSTHTHTHTHTHTAGARCPWRHSTALNTPSRAHRGRPCAACLRMRVQELVFPHLFQCIKSAMLPLLSISVTGQEVRTATANWQGQQDQGTAPDTDPADDL